MADIVNTGATANDGSGDDLRTAFQLINERLQQLLGTLSQITWAPGLAIEATPARQWTIQSGQAYVATSNHIAGATFAADLAAGRWLLVDLVRLEADLASTAAGKGAAKVGKSGGGTVQDHIDSAAAGDAGYKTRLLAGVIRQDTAGGGWYFIDDSGHKPNGLTSVTVNGTGELVVSYGFTAANVGSLVVAPDEVYANLGISAGSSVGDASATIHLYQDLYGTVNLATRSLASNTFFTGTLSAVLNADGTVTVTHPNCGSASVGCYGGDTQGFDVRVQSYTATTVTFASWVDFSGYIEYNGTAWVVSTQAYNVPTVAFSGGVLTVTHELLATQDANVTVDGRDTGVGTNTVHVRPGASTTTTFEAVFRDNAGALITTPNTSMRLYYSGVARVKRASPLGTINFLRPNCKLNAGNVASGSGNFWIMGAMKVA